MDPVKPVPVQALPEKPKKVAEATGIPSEDIDPHFPIQTVSTGVPFTVLPLRGL